MENYDYLFQTNAKINIAARSTNRGDFFYYMKIRGSILATKNCLWSRHSY